MKRKDGSFTGLILTSTLNDDGRTEIAGGRGFILSASIPAKKTIILGTIMGYAFHANGIVVPGSMAPFFLLRDIRINKKSQIPATMSPIPCEVFSGQLLFLDRCLPKQRFEIEITNAAVYKNPFRVAILGHKL